MKTTVIEQETDLPVSRNIRIEPKYDYIELSQDRFSGYTSEIILQKSNADQLALAIAPGFADQFAIGYRDWCFEYENSQAYISCTDEEKIEAYKEYLKSKP